VFFVFLAFWERSTHATQSKNGAPPKTQSENAPHIHKWRIKYYDIDILRLKYIQCITNSMRRGYTCAYCAYLMPIFAFELWVLENSQQRVNTCTRGVACIARGGSEKRTTPKTHSANRPSHPFLKHRRKSEHPLCKTPQLPVTSEQSIISVTDRSSMTFRVYEEWCTYMCWVFNLNIFVY